MLTDPTVLPRMKRLREDLSRECGEELSLLITPAGAFFLIVETTELFSFDTPEEILPFMRERQRRYPREAK